MLVVVDFQDYGFYGGVAGDEDSWGLVSWGWGCGGRRIGGMGKIGKGEETGVDEWGEVGGVAVPLVALVIA